MVIIWRRYLFLYAYFFVLQDVIKKKKKLSYEIEDRTLNSDYSCATALEKFYSDEFYDYSFPCLKSNYVIVVFSNSSKKNIIDALNDKDVKVEDLDTFNIKYYKTEKNRP